MPLTLEAAYRSLKGGDAVPVYYITGDEDILKEELVEAIVTAAVDPAARDFNLDIRNAGDLDGEALHALVETPPMLAERRAVVVKGLEQWRANAAVWRVLAQYLERPSPSTMLALVHGAGEKPNATLASAARHIHVDPLTTSLARRWTLKRAERAGITLEADAAAHLVTAVGSDLAHVAMEIDKLAAACPADRPVGVTDVARLVGVLRGETLADWVGAVLAREPAVGVRLLGVVLPQPGVTGVRLVMSLGTALVGTRFAKALMDGGTSAAAVEGAILKHLRETRPPGLGVWKDEAHRWAQSASLWTVAELDEGLRTLYQADRALLRIAQITYASGDLNTARQSAQRVLSDYPFSLIRAQAAFWAGRSQLDLGDFPSACRLLTQAADSAVDDVELANRARFYVQRCQALPLTQRDSTPRDTTSAAAAPAAPATATATMYAVQFSAVRSPALADQAMQSLKRYGYEPRVSRDADGFLRVRIGRFKTKTEAQRLATEIRRKLGGTPFVVEEQ